MRIHLAPTYEKQPQAQELKHLLQSCVQCGMCTATCPTFQVTGNELDGPRGRLQLVGAYIAGHRASQETLYHLDTCLQCRSCETTCPSKVPVVNIIQQGMQLVVSEKKFAWYHRVRKRMLRALVRSQLFPVLYKLGQKVHFLFPAKVQTYFYKQVPPAKRIGISAFDLKNIHKNRIFWISGCVQPTMMPNIDRVGIDLLRNLGYEVHILDKTCCGAIDWHAGALEQAKLLMRRNITQWQMLAQQFPGALFLSSASACEATIHRYPEYFEKNSQEHHAITQLLPHFVSIASIFLKESTSIKKHLQIPHNWKVAYHAPCTQQHWMSQPQEIPVLLQSLGYQCVDAAEPALCCGAAGLYRLEHAHLSKAVQKRKVDALNATQVQMILSANMGCIGQLQAGNATPVKHWLEMVAEHWVA